MWYIPGHVTLRTPSSAKGTQFRSATLVYTIGIFSPYCSASFCSGASSGQR